MKTTTAFLVLALAGIANAGLFPAGGKVKPLEAKNWKKTLGKDDVRAGSFTGPVAHFSNNYCAAYIQTASRSCGVCRPLVWPLPAPGSRDDQGSEQHGPACAVLRHRLRRGRQ